LRLNQVPFLEQAKVAFGSLNSESDNIPDETRGANLEAIYTWNENFRSLIGFDFKDAGPIRRAISFTSIRLFR